MQGFIILATISTDNTLKYFAQRHDDKIGQSQWSLTYRSRVPGQGSCLLSKSRKITMQGFVTLATISTEIHTLVFYPMSQRKI